MNGLFALGCVGFVGCGACTAWVAFRPERAILTNAKPKATTAKAAAKTVPWTKMKAVGARVSGT
eukprot:CAMPEP_0175185358 /NCGR_PEP_ID=MMETSP0093-20121207/1839_1 /TAXON_ID=311494 /ORGANISM="Alexandrium monilatum, Strain CCMP3105" /LENGTH=63 /DNA_ID=CAMNT_0016478055 /DNA_START=226 /DNA_END=413 /DNA_ORIENTATION=+